MSLYSETHGQGAPLLMIAGVASDSVSWQLQAPELSRHFQVVLFDNKGVGRSPVPDEPYSLDSMARDAVDILDRYKIEKAHIVSHSMGSAIAQIVARDYPERVDRMVLAAPFPRLSSQARLAIEGWVLALAEGCSAELFTRTLFPWLFTDSFLSVPGCFEACLEGFKNHPYPLTALGLKRQYEALKGFDSTSWLEQLNVPSLLLAGSQDILTPLSQAETMAKKMPNALLEVLEAGHSALVESAPDFNRAIQEFLLPEPAVA